MRGEKPADVLVVRFSIFVFPSVNGSPASPTQAKIQELQVAHGLILRAFAKRWINYSLGQDLPMEIQPGGIAVLRYVLDTIGIRIDV